MLILLLFGAWIPAGKTDEVMRRVQEELRKRNLYFGDINGLYSPQVAAALRRYQQRKGFAPTGEADDPTLNSLSLINTVVAAATPALTPIPGAGILAAPLLPIAEALTMPWPDLPVLRSDLGRENPDVTPDEPATLDPTPTPSLKPPPAAAFQRGFDEGKIQELIETFLKQGESNDPAAQQDFFADKVDYFNEGAVDKAFIARDTTRYNKRWPVRQFHLIGPLQISGTVDASPERLVVNFRCAFDVKQAVQPEKDSKEVKGMVENTYNLARGASGEWRIDGIKEQRVRSK